MCHSKGKFLFSQKINLLLCLFSFACLNSAHAAFLKPFKVNICRNLLYLASNFTKIQNSTPELVHELRHLREKVWPDSVDPSYADIESSHAHQNHHQAAMRIRGIEKFYYAPDDTQETGQAKRTLVYRLRGNTEIENFIQMYQSLEVGENLPLIKQITNHIFIHNAVLLGSGQLLNSFFLFAMGTSNLLTAALNLQLMQTNKFSRFIRGVQKDLKFQNVNAWMLVGLSRHLTVDDVKNLTTIPYRAVQTQVTNTQNQTFVIDSMTLQNPSLEQEIKNSETLPPIRKGVEYLFRNLKKTQTLWTAADVFYYRDEAGIPNLIIASRTFPTRPKFPKGSRDLNREKALEIKAELIPLRVNSQ